MWKVCLTICMSPPACLCHSLINHEVRYWNANALAIYSVSLQLPERKIVDLSLSFCVPQDQFM